MLKSTFVKLPPKRLLYRSYKRFNRNYFLYDLEYSLKEFNTTEYKEYEATFASVLDRHAPLKTKILRGNNRPHVSKHLRKEIMKRSRLKNIATRSQKPEDWSNYRIQRNLVVNINKKAKKTLFDSVDINSSQGSKAFWKTCKPFFSNKGSIVEERILLVENETIVSDDGELSTIFNKYFNTITNGLNISKWNEEFSSSSVEATEIAIEKYADHPSILMIKEKFKIDKPFEFKEISTHDTYSEILKLNRGKKVSGNIPIKLLQLATREVPHVSVALTQCFNNSIESCIFPDELTWAEIVPIHKKDSTTDKSNYRPISLLPTISKVFEKIVFKQLTAFLDHKLSKFLCGFRKRYSTQHALINLIQDWQRVLDRSGKVGAVLMDLSKAFDCLPHDLLIAKLEAYGFGRKSLRFLHSYLSNRKQRVRIGSSLSEWLLVLLGVPQGSILGPILFNIFINDLLLFINDSDICNFADDNTLSVCDTSVDRVLKRLEFDVNVAINWFHDNSLVANPSKFQILFLGIKNSNDLSIQIDGKTMHSTETVKLLGVTLDNKLCFLPHIKDICRRANHKTKALLRIRSNLTQEKAEALSNSFILSAFNYCPLIWMFSGKQGNDLIKTVHRRSLRAVLNDFYISYDEMLDKTNKKAIHEKNLEVLMIEVYKSLNSLNPEFMWSMFLPKDCPYNLRLGNVLTLPKAKHAIGSNSILFRGALAWNYLPKEIKECTSLSTFKAKVKKHKVYCHCKICS